VTSSKHTKKWKWQESSDHFIQNSTRPPSGGLF
jgi:hypothetical protein